MKKRLCAVKDGKAYVGSTRQGVVGQIGTVMLVGNAMVLVFRHPGYKDRVCHSYSEEWTEHQAARDAHRHVFETLLPEYGYTLFKEI